MEKEDLFEYIPIVGTFILLIAFLIPNISGSIYTWIWGFYSYGSSFSLFASLFHFLSRIILSLIIFLKVIKILRLIIKMRKGVEELDTFKKALNKKSILIFILAVLIVITNRICLPYDLNVNLLLQGEIFVLNLCPELTYNTNFSIPGFNIMMLFIGAIIVNIGARLYDKEVAKTAAVEKKTEKDSVLPVKVEEGEEGLSEKYPDIVVTKRNIQNVLISGLILSIIGTIIIPIALSLEPFFDTFDTFAQVIGTGIGLAIVGYFFLFMHFFMPTQTKKIIASIKGTRAKAKAKKQGKSKS